MEGVKVGQVVVVSARAGYLVGYKVTKITPSGQVVVENKAGDKLRFDKRGFELGGPDAWNRKLLISDPEEVAGIHRGLRIKSARNKVVRIAGAFGKTVPEDADPKTLLTFLVGVEEDLSDLKTSLSRLSKPEKEGA